MSIHAYIHTYIHTYIDVNTDMKCCYVGFLSDTYINGMLGILTYIVIHTICVYMYEMF